MEGTQQQAQAVDGPDHAVRFFGLRFTDPRTERAYRRWRSREATNVVRIGYLGSVPSWALLLVAIALFDGDALDEAGPPIAGWIVTLAVLTALTYREALRPWTLHLAALANCLAGFLVVWLIFDVVHPEGDVAWQAGLMTAGMLIVMFFGFAVYRVPPALATAAITPYVGFATYKLVDAQAAGDLETVEMAGLASGQWIAYLGGVLVCILIEVVNRGAFRRDEIITAQQRQLRESREEMRRYLAPSVADHIVRGTAEGVGEPTRRRVTVMFVDLVNSTPLADRVEAEVLTRVVDDFMSATIDIVEGRNGTVTEFAGDGFMAFFGAPDPMEPEEQAIRAIRAAHEMHAHMPVLQEAWYRLGATEPLSMRVGINTGVVSVGSFGSRGRRTYTALGIQANIAARLQTQCRPGGILISDATWHLVKDRVTCEPRGEVECRGVHYPVRAHEPVGEDNVRPLVVRAAG